MFFLLTPNTSNFDTHALEIFSEFCDEGESDTDYSGISKKIGGDAWNYPFDPKGKN